MASSPDVPALSFSSNNDNSDRDESERTLASKGSMPTRPQSALGHASPLKSIGNFGAGRRPATAVGARNSGIPSKVYEEEERDEEEKRYTKKFAEGATLNMLKKQPELFTITTQAHYALITLITLTLNLTTQAHYALITLVTLISLTLDLTSITFMLGSRSGNF